MRADHDFNPAQPQTITMVMVCGSPFWVPPVPPPAYPMDFDTARQFVLRQTLGTSDDLPDTFIACLRQGKPPIPGQVTSLLLALKVLFAGLQQEPSLDRPLVQALFILSYESRQLFNAGQKTGVTWPPMLDDDLVRLAKGAQSIIFGEWQG